MEMDVVLSEIIGSISRFKRNFETGIDAVEEKSPVVIL